MLELIDGRDQLTPVHVPRPRPGGPQANPAATVESILDDVRLRGDAAMFEYSERFEGVRPQNLRVDEATIAHARSLVRPELIDAIEVGAERLRRTCERQVPHTWLDRSDGETIGELIRPLRRVGVYVPGGRAAYPSTVVMAAIPARVAGVGGIAVCSPPGPSGEIPEAILAACAVAGVDEVYRIGGAHAIAALACGTE